MRKKSMVTERKAKILKLLEKYQTEFGYPPTIREISTLTDIPSTSAVIFYIDKLIEEGYIERDSRTSRGIRLKKSPSRKHTFPDGKVLPVKLVGMIAAGEPLSIPESGFDIFDSVETVSIPTDMLPGYDVGDLFALQVTGDSMIDALVFDGDKVILERCLEPKNGEMVAAWLNAREETTLKYFYREPKRIRLQPANPNYKPIFVRAEDELLIQGKVVLVIRKP